MIKKTADKNEWCVFSETGKNMGCYSSKKKAEERLAQIEQFKHMNEIAGQGQGVGGPKQGDGGQDVCVCPSCGKTVSHEKGVPCLSIICPSCGSKMIGKTKESIATTEEMLKAMAEQIDTDGGIEKVLRALLVDQYGLEKAQANQVVKAGFDKEKVMEVMDEIGMADKLKADYLSLVGMWRNDVDSQSYNDLEFLMKESQVPFQLIEAVNVEGTVWKVVVIEEGKSYNKTVYSAKALEDIVKIINEADKDSAPVKSNAFKLEDTLGHLPDTARKFIKGFAENIVGWFKNAKKVGKQVIAELHLDEGAEKIKSLLLSAYKKGIKKPFGLSIDGDGVVEESWDGTEPILNVLGVKSLQSIDCVTWPSAGGKFLSLIESVLLEDQKMLRLLLEMVGRIFPALIEGIDLKSITLETVKEALGKAAGEDERFKVELTEENVGEVIKTVTDIEGAIREEKAKAALSAAPPAPPVVPAPQKAEPKNDGLKEARDALDEIAKLREETEKEKCRLLLTRVLDESALPDVFKDNIRDEFKDTAFTEEVLRTKVASVEKAVAIFKDGGSETRVTVTTEERDKKFNWLQEEMDKLCGEYVNEKGEHQPNDRGMWRGSIKRAYVDLTGDENVDGNIAVSRKSRLAENIVSGDFPELLANSQTKKLVRNYNVGDPLYRKIAKIGPLDDFKVQDRVAFGEFGYMDTVAEDADYTEFADPSEEKATYTALTKGNIIGISRRTLLNDDLRKFNQMVAMLGRSALITLNRYAFDIGPLNYATAINDGVIYDTKVLYHADHANIGTTALSYTTLDAALTAMWNQKDMDTTLEYGIEAKYLIVPRALKATAERIVNTQKLPGGGDNDVNPVYKSVEIIVSKYLRGDANNWYLLADPQVWDGLEIGFVLGREIPTIVTANQEQVGLMFTKDEIQYKVRHEYGAGVLDYRPFYGAIVA